MKKQLSILLFFFLMLPKVFAQEQEFNEVIAIARAGYTNYLQKIPEGREKYYGFNNRNEFEITEVGKPYQILNLQNDFFTDQVLSDKNYLVSVDEWRVALTVKGENRVLVTVAKMDGAWKVVGLGASVLAMELAKYDKTYPSSNPWGTILNVHQLQSDYFFSYKGSSITDLKIYPLMAESNVLKLNTPSVSYFSLHQLLLLVKANLINR